MAKLELYAPRRADDRRTWAWASIPLVVVFVVAGALLSTTLGRFIGIMTPKGANPAYPHWLFSTYANLSYAFIAALIFLWVWWVERRGLDAIGLNGRFLVRYGRGLLLGAVMMGLLVASGYALGGYGVVGEGLWRRPDASALVPVVAMAAAFMVQGACEEIAFRGWQMQVLASRWGVVWAVLINTGLFTWLHAGNIALSPELGLGLVNIALDTLFISLYAMKDGSIWGVCGQHFVWNWLMGAGFGLEVSGTKQGVAPLFAALAPRAGAPWWLTGGAFGPEGTVMMTVIDVVCLAIVVGVFAARPPRGHEAPAA